MCTWELVLGDPPFLPAARMGPEKTPPSGGHRDPAGSSPPPAPSSSPLSSLEGSAASTSERSPSAGAQGSLGAGVLVVQNMCRRWQLRASLGHARNKESCTEVPLINPTAVFDSF